MRRTRTKPQAEEAAYGGAKVWAFGEIIFLRVWPKSDGEEEQIDIKLSRPQALTLISRIADALSKEGATTKTRSSARMVGSKKADDSKRKGYVLKLNRRTNR